MHTPTRRPRALAAAVVIGVLVVLAAACGGSCGSAADETATSASPGGPSPLPSALTETYTSGTYDFSFKYPSGFEVQVEPDFIQSETDVFDLALLPTGRTMEAYGFPPGNLVRLVVIVTEATEGEMAMDSDAVTQQMVTGIQDYLGSLENLDSTGVEPVDIDGFAGAQVAYSHDTPEGRTDTWTLTLVEPEGGYSLEIQATSPGDVADQLEPVWTEVINSFTTP